MNAVSPIPSVATSRAADETPPQQQLWQPKISSLLTRVFAVALVGVGMAAILAAWQLPPFSTRVVKTDNAYVRGRTTVISPQVTGYIREISVKDYAAIKQGDVLLHIDDRVYRAQVAAAQADLDIASSNLANNKQTIAQRKLDITTAEAKIASANAQLIKAEADFKRASQLAGQGSGSVSAEDATRASRGVAVAAVQEAAAGRGSAEQALRAASVNEKALEADVESARAKLQLAEINLGYTVVNAPEDGKLSDVSARQGQYVTNGSQLMFLGAQGTLGHRQLQRGTVGGDTPRTARLVLCRRIGGGPLRRDSRGHFASCRIRIFGFAYRQRDRQLHEDTATYRCPHPDRREPARYRAARPGNVRGSPC
ncbi:biotin/lipoyl-binding protein [Rhizobium sp.]|uniref:HlyD family secretion protein n=1 Tax=Rhizobium sp. TaxID=391 RepID=UPI00289E1486